jgi:hypothetical protein
MRNHNFELRIRFRIGNLTTVFYQRFKEISEGHKNVSGTVIMIDPDPTGSAINWTLGFVIQDYGSADPDP